MKFWHALDPVRRLSAQLLRKTWCEQLATSLDAAQRNGAAEPSDRLTVWISQAHAGTLVPGNLECLDYAIGNLPSNAPILEIGSFCGLSTNLITYYKRKHGRINRLFSCDGWVYEGDGALAPVTPDEYRSLIKESYLRNTGLFSRDDLPYTIETFPDGMFSAWRNEHVVWDIRERPVKLGGPISFCFVAHRNAQRHVFDFENCDAFLQPGGFLFFDGAADRVGRDTIRAINQVQDSRRYEVVLANPNHLFRKLF